MLTEGMHHMTEQMQHCRDAAQVHDGPLKPELNGSRAGCMHSLCSTSVAPHSFITQARTMTISVIDNLQVAAVQVLFSLVVRLYEQDFVHAAIAQPGCLVLGQSNCLLLF